MRRQLMWCSLASVLLVAPAAHASPSLCPSGSTYTGTESKDGVTYIYCTYYDTVLQVGPGGGVIGIPVFMWPNLLPAVPTTGPLAPIDTGLPSPDCPEGAHWDPGITADGEVAGCVPDSVDYLPPDSRIPPLQPKEKQQPGDAYDPARNCWVPAAQIAAAFTAGVVVKKAGMLIIETVGVDVTYQQASGGPYTKIARSTPEAMQRLGHVIQPVSQASEVLANGAVGRTSTIVQAEALGGELRLGTPTAAQSLQTLRGQLARWFGTGVLAAFLMDLASPSNAGTGSDLGYRCR